MSSLEKASFDEILWEIRKRISSYRTCLIGEAVAKRKLSDEQRRNVVYTDMDMAYDQSISGRTFSWVHEGERLLYDANVFTDKMKNVKERNRP